MKGVIVFAMREMMIEKFGERKWKELLKKAGIDKKSIILPISDISDQIVMKIINASCELLNMPLNQLADTFGDYWVNVYTQKVYHHYYEDCKTAKEFLIKLNEIHFTTTRTTSNANPPKFEYEWEDDKTLIMHYKSPRGLIDFVVGLAKGVGKLYKEDLKVTKLDNERVKIVFPY